MPELFPSRWLIEFSDYPNNKARIMRALVSRERYQL